MTPGFSLQGSLNTRHKAKDPLLTKYICTCFVIFTYKVSSFHIERKMHVYLLTPPPTFFLAAVNVGTGNVGCKLERMNGTQAVKNHPLNERAKLSHSFLYFSLVNNFQTILNINVSFPLVPL